MVSTNGLSSLLATLYAAPLEPEMWQRFLEQVCDAAKISCGYIVASHATEGNTLLAGGGLNFDPAVLHLYNEHYGANDPYRAPMITKPRVGLIAGEELVDHAALVRSELYNEVLSRYDMEYMNMLSCRCDHEAVDALSLWRSAKHGPMDAASSQLLEMLIPHVQTALKLRTKVVGCNASNVFSEAALDAMSIAALLVTDKRYVRHMNTLAVQCLKVGDGLRLWDGRVVPTDSKYCAQFELLVAGAASMDSAVRGGGMRISRKFAVAPPLHVTAAPIPHQNRIANGERLAVVFIGDRLQSPKSRIGLMRQMYGLSPSEARVADLLMQGFDVREAAERLDGTLESTRFRVKRILAKTGTRRQSELMQLMLSLPGCG
jgi:DNA-binding CsgD family transcriptional regulator